MFLGVWAPPLPARAAPPNVLLIISDDQAWGDYSFLGHETIATPNIDRLAKESLTFTRGYVPSSLCRPSLMSIITGRYPHEHKVSGNDPPRGTDRTEMLKHIRGAVTLPKLLGDAGYVSLQTGKWWEGNYALGGFTHGMTHGDPARGGRHGDEGLRIGREGLAPIFEVIESRGERPFFIWYAPFLPHSPHNPPERLLAKYRDKTDSLHVARYWAMCEWFDETCGELLGYLDREGLADNTLVVYVTDNGWIQDPASPRFADRSKRSPYEGGVRTPIMLRWPGHVEPRHDGDTPVSSIDLAPTILAACGIEWPRELVGANLLDSDELARRRDEGVFGEIFEHDVTDIDNAAASLLYRWCVVNRWKLIVPNGDGPVELFDVVADPHETKNLAEQQPEIVRKLTARLDNWWTPTR
jgi:uncharacterized sulfatase